MCTICGLPSSHTNTVQTLGYLTLASFTLTTFLGAWLIVTSAKVKRLHVRAYQLLIRVFQLATK